MSNNKPIKISEILPHVRIAGDVGYSMSKWMQTLDKEADKAAGRSPDGLFTKQNFRFFQRMGIHWLRKKHPAAVFLRHFRTFSDFNDFIERSKNSQHCQDPRVKRAIAQHNKNHGSFENPDRKAKCVPGPKVFLPPFIKRKPPRPRKPKPKIRPRPKAPPKPNPKDSMLSMRPGKRKGNNVHRVDNPPKRARPNTTVSDEELRRALVLPSALNRSSGLLCRSTRDGLRCTINRSVVSIGDLCSKYRDRLPAAVEKQCPRRVPDMKMIARTLYIKLKRRGLCISKCKMRRMRRKNPLAHFFLRRILSFLPSKIQCNSSCPTPRENFVKRVNPDGTVTFRKWRPKIGIKGLKLIVNFDITFAIMQARGEDPYAPQKLRYLDRTRAARIKMRKKWKRSVEKGYFKHLDSRLLRLWQRTNMTYAEKRQTLFELWDECLDDIGTARATRAQRARGMIIAFIRKHLPKGSPHAYTAAELRKIADLRQGEMPFKPYSS